MEFLSSNILRLLVLTAATRQLAEDYGVEPTSAYTDSLAVQEQSAEVLPPEAAEASVVIGSSGDYLSDILTSIGRQTLVEDGAEEPNTDEALVRGQDVLSVWLTKNEPEIDPQFGIEVNNLEPTVSDTSTSFAVSDEATIARRSDLFGGDPAQLSAADQEELTELTDYARSLPESQRCG